LSAGHIKTYRPSPKDAPSHGNIGEIPGTFSPAHVTPSVENRTAGPTLSLCVAATAPIGLPVAVMSCVPLIPLAGPRSVHIRPSVLVQASTGPAEDGKHGRATVGQDASVTTSATSPAAVSRTTIGPAGEPLAAFIHVLPSVDAHIPLSP
jgi:hypothetical protein